MRECRSRSCRVPFNACDAGSHSLSLSLLRSSFLPLSRLRALTISIHISFQLLPIFSPPATLSPAHLASLIMGRPRRDRALSYGADKAAGSSCARVLRDKLFFRSSLDYRTSSKFSRRTGKDRRGQRGGERSEKE